VRFYWNETVKPVTKEGFKERRRALYTWLKSTETVPMDAIYTAAAVGQLHWSLFILSTFPYVKRCSEPSTQAVSQLCAACPLRTAELFLYEWIWHRQDSFTLCASIRSISQETAAAACLHQAWQEINQVKMISLCKQANADTDRTVLRVPVVCVCLFIWDSLVCVSAIFCEGLGRDSRQVKAAAVDIYNQAYKL